MDGFSKVKIVNSLAEQTVYSVPAEFNKKEEKDFCSKINQTSHKDSLKIKEEVK